MEQCGLHKELLSHDLYTQSFVQVIQYCTRLTYIDASMQHTIAQGYSDIDAEDFTCSMPGGQFRVSFSHLSSQPPLSIRSTYRQMGIN